MESADIKVAAAARTYRDQCLFFLDSIANQNGFVAELLEKIKALENAPDQTKDERIAELEQIVREKDEQITEQSNTIRSLRGDA